MPFVWIVRKSGILFAADAWAELRGTRVTMPDLTAPGSDQQLLLQCVRANRDASDRVKVLAQTVTDWNALADAAEYHGLAAVLYRALDRAAPGLAPENIQNRLQNGYRDSARRNLILTTQLLALLDIFAAEGIAVLPLKGPALAELLYPDPLLRTFSDLDLLVREQDVPASLRVLAREGYTLSPHLARLPFRALMRLDFQLLLHHPRKAPVDLQWDTAPTDFPFSFDPEILWRSRTSISIDGRQVPSLCPETLLLYLCVHGTKHLWSRLQWLGDLARLVAIPPNWAGVSKLAAEAGCERPLLLGLLLARDLLDAPVPEEIVAQARAQPIVQTRANQVSHRLMRIPPVEPQGAEFTTFNAGMAERTRDKLRHYAALFKAPTDKELELFPLPEPLFFLYYPLRTVRLVLKYAQQLARR